jgi:hypothetical protein
MTRRILTLALSLALVACGTSAFAADGFGVIKGPSFDQAKTQAMGWLKDQKADADTLKKAEELWNPTVDRSLLDRVVETFMAVDPEIKKLILDARDPAGHAPTGVPELLKDPSRPAFVRNNLAVYFAKQMALRRVFEEAQEALKGVRPRTWWTPRPITSTRPSPRPRSSNATRVCSRSIGC